MKKTTKEVLENDKMLCKTETEKKDGFKDRHGLAKPPLGWLKHTLSHQSSPDGHTSACTPRRTKMECKVGEKTKIWKK